MQAALCIVAGAALALGSGCSQLVTTAADAGLVSRTTNEHGAGYLVPPRPVIPNAKLQLTPSYGITLENLLIGAAAVYFVDPLAPNWSGEVRRLSDDTFSIALRMKRFKTGGDGEALRALRRNAEQLVREGGYDDYTILALSEGIESETLGAVRYSEGVIRVSRAAPR